MAIYTSTIAALTQENCFATQLHFKTFGIGLAPGNGAHVSGRFLRSCISSLRDILSSSKMPVYPLNLKFRDSRSTRKTRSLIGAAGVLTSTPIKLLIAASAAARLFLAAAILFTAFCPPAGAQNAGSSAPPVVVQPGAPGQPSKVLSASTRGTLPPLSRADVKFMQGMIMHHSQAVEMTALIPSHTENKELRELGARISSSQSSEINFMQRWLAARGQSLSMPMSDMPGRDMPGEAKSQSKSGTSDADKHGQAIAPPMALMPGMLTPEQMEALRKAKGAEFDYLFLTGMIQHHNGALIMVKDLFDTAGAGQDADIFNFATDADNTQRAEIRIMQGMLEKKQFEEKR
jgi:uncharacterized protein (DUF305 family)